MQLEAEEGEQSSAGRRREGEGRGWEYGAREGERREKWRRMEVVKQYWNVSGSRKAFFSLRTRASS
jgi:hypothetical protein